MNRLEVKNQDELEGTLAKIHDTDSNTNWVRLSYDSKNVIMVESSGEGGLAEFREGLQDDLVQFGVLDFFVEGDNYATHKVVLVTWIGTDVPGGLTKARAAAHRKELRDIVQETVNVASELQASTKEELNEDMVGQAISRTRGGVYAKAGASHSAKKSASKGGSGTASAMTMSDPEAVDAALNEVATGGADHWCILAYVKGKKDEVELIRSGDGGLSALGKEWPPEDRAYFCYCAISYKPGNDVPQTKYVLVTLIGDGVSPLARARTSGQRVELVRTNTGPS
mmetsp:Transcript_26875/g.75120  ORF Transcript_26875/g.75120 Transcript_26875/m.75120 type:complete len:282 (-) Transcript_26875:273-1118(-)